MTITWIRRDNGGDKTGEATYHGRSQPSGFHLQLRSSESRIIFLRKSEASSIWITHYFPLRQEYISNGLVKHLWNNLENGENYGLEINFDLNNLDANTVVLIRTSVCKLINVCFVFYLIIFEWINVKAVHFSFMSNCSLDFIFFSVK